MTPHSPTGDPASPGGAPVLTQCSPCPTQPPASPGEAPVLTRCDLSPTQDDCAQEVAPFLTRQSTVSPPASPGEAPVLTRCDLSPTQTPAFTSGIPGASGTFQSCPCPTQQQEDCTLATTPTTAPHSPTWAPASPGGAQKLTQSDLCPTQQDDEWALIEDYISQDLQTWDNWVQEVAPFCAGQPPLLQDDEWALIEDYISQDLQTWDNWVQEVAPFCAGQPPLLSPASTSGAPENFHSLLLQSMLTPGPCPTQNPASTSGAPEHTHSSILQSILSTDPCSSQSPASTRGAPGHTHSATLQSMLTTDQNMAQHECKDYKNVFKKKYKPVIQKIDDKTHFYYECPFCIRHFSKLNLLEHHIKIKHNEKPEFPCSECDKKFSRASCRNRHERSCSLLREKRTQGYTCNEPEAMDVDVVTHGVGAQAQPVVEEAEQPSNLDNECVGASAKR